MIMMRMTIKIKIYNNNQRKKERKKNTPITKQNKQTYSTNDSKPNKIIAVTEK